MNRLKELRKIKGKNQTQVANAVGIAQTTLSGYENETRQMDYDNMKKLADYFEVSVDYLLGREQSENSPIQPKKHTVISIGRGGERREYEISDEDAAIVDAFLEKMRKNK